MSRNRQDSESSSIVSAFYATLARKMSTAIEWIFYGNEWRLRHEEFESNPHNLDLNEIVGRGSTGLVRRSHEPIKLEGSDEETYYAGKTFVLWSSNSTQYELQMRRIKREIQALRECTKDCDFIVAFIDAFFDGKDGIELGTEFCELGSLYTVLSITRVRGEALRSVVYCMVSALAHVHNIGYVHGDVKPTNLLVNGRGIVKLCDFGAAQKVQNSLETDSRDVGTLRYAPPEVLPRFLRRCTYEFDHMRDIWALALVVQDIFYGPDLPRDFDVEHPKLNTEQTLDLSDDEFEFYQQHGYTRASPTTEELWIDIVNDGRLGLERAGTKGEASADVIAFVRSCLAMGRAHRPSARELLNSKYIARQKTKLVFRNVLSGFASELREERSRLEREMLEESGEPEPVRGFR